jgi:hypothetical protein
VCSSCDGINYVHQQPVALDRLKAWYFLKNRHVCNAEVQLGLECERAQREELTPSFADVEIPRMGGEERGYLSLSFESTTKIKPCVFVK